MTRRTQQFIAAFAISCIVIAGLCGFVAVDMGSTRYMTGEGGSLFQVTGIDAESVRFSAMGENYTVDVEHMEPFHETIWSWRGLLPNSVNLTAGAVTQVYIQAHSYREASRQEDEPW